MKMRFPEEVNGHLMNLMTIARHDSTAQNCAAVQAELLKGQALLLVPAQPSAEGGNKVTFTHAPTEDGRITLLAFTGEAAVRAFAQEDIALMVIPSGAFFRSCLKNGIATVIMDPKTPNELRIGLNAPRD